MEKYLYHINDSDELLVKKVKAEGNIILSSVIDKYGPNSEEFINEEHKIDKLISLFMLTDSFGVKSISDNIILFKDVNKFLDKGLLSPLTLDDSEFSPTAEENYYINNRYEAVYKITNQSFTTIGNTNAYIGFVKKGYSHDHSKEFATAPDWLRGGKIYITKGGVITGEYFDTRSCQVIINNKKDYSYLSKIIHIPVSVIQHIINNINQDIYTVDSRDPMFKHLCTIYNVAIYNDNDIKGKYDIRKYEKITK